MTRTRTITTISLVVIGLFSLGAGREPTVSLRPSVNEIVTERREAMTSRQSRLDASSQVVAPAGSGRTPSASFRCDGIDDQVEIQAAIDALPEGGGTVRLMPGTYHVARSASGGYSIRIARSDVTLQLDPGARIRLADGQFDGAAGNVIEIDGSVPIRRIRILGPGVIDGNRAANSGVGIGDNACVRLRNKVDDVIIGDGLHLAGCRGDAIFAKGVFQGQGDARSVDLTIRDIRITDSDEGILWTVWDRVRIRDFVIEDIREQDGLESVDSVDWIIESGFIRRTQGSAIDVFAAPPTTTGSSRRGLIRQVHMNEILGGSQVVNIGVGVGNDVTDIQLSDCTIRNSRGTQTGITVGAFATDGAEVRNVLIDSVNIEGIPGTAVYFGPACRDCRLTNSSISESGWSAIRIEGTRSSVVGVKMFDNNRTATSEQANVIVGAGAARTTLRNLEIFGTSQQATEGRSIRIDPGASHTVVGNCHCYGLVFDDVLDLGEGTVFE